MFERLSRLLWVIPFGFILPVVADLWSWWSVILTSSTGYTINIYVELFHSEKQFDELEIFDGM